MVPPDVPGLRAGSLLVTRRHTQRACGFVAGATVLSLQMHLGKITGGVRPIALLTGTFKAIEGTIPIARRKAVVRKTVGPGAVYSATSLAGEIGQPAAQSVLYLDTLVCENSEGHDRPVCRIPSEHDKCYNTFERAALDAVEDHCGIPPEVRSCRREILDQVRLRIQLRWGWGSTGPVRVKRGAPP